MNHSTSIDECRDFENEMSRIQERSSIQAKMILKLQNLSQIYMNSAARYIHPSSAHVCILLSDRALEYMLKALYMKVNNSMSPPHSLSLNDVIQLTVHESVPDLDTVMFIHTIHFLSSCKDISLIRQMHASQLQKLLNRVDDVLIVLSGRVTSFHKE